ncbi:hypothetical protein MCERE3_00481 [Candidatus Nanopelagicaceae bacterium]
MNKHLLLSIQNWKNEGAREQDGAEWTPTERNWVEAFPEYEVFLRKLPKVIDRGIVRDICNSKANSIVEKFLTTMVWGYSDRGYGAFRVSTMLAEEHAERTLLQVSKLANQSQPKEAYEFLKGNRIYNLGPSYGTKFIAFNTPRVASAPILDSLVILWLKEFARGDFSGLSLSSTTWNSKTYSAYCDWIGLHAEAASCFPDEVELNLFRDAEKRFAKASGWSGK